MAVDVVVEVRVAVAVAVGLAPRVLLTMGVTVAVGVRVGLSVGVRVDVAVAVRVAVAVGVGLAERVLVAVGGGSELNSYAPMSQMAVPLASPFTGRTKPRWSVVKVAPKPSVQPPGLPASIAGLPFSSAWVWVGPPLSCRAPSSALTPVLL